MDLNRLTEKAQEALRAAQSEATRLGHQQLDVEHLLLALLDQQGGHAPAPEHGRGRRLLGLRCLEDCVPPAENSRDLRQELLPERRQRDATRCAREDAVSELLLELRDRVRKRSLGDSARACGAAEGSGLVRGEDVLKLDQRHPRLPP